MPAPDTLRASLTELVLRDPRQARSLLLNTIDADTETTDRFLRGISGPEYSRLRNLVSNVAKNHPQKARFVPFLIDWRDNETDEFTRRAIYAALADVDERSYQKTVDERRALPPQTVEIYQYLSDRLKHRLRNAMLAAHAYAVKLQVSISGDAPNEIRGLTAKLQDAMLTLGRVLEATDVEPEYFKERGIPITDWLTQMNTRYAARYSAIRFKVVADNRTSFVVLGSDYLLETIFWNLWMNAHQAIGSECEISVLADKRGEHVELIIIDNGAGFSEDLLGVAFSQAFSTNSPQRGRGLLEVSEAVTRLRGSIELFECNRGDFRVKIRLRRFEP